MKTATKKTENKAVATIKATETANVISTIVNKEQRYLYKFQVGGEKLLPAKAKQYRQKLRRKLDNFFFAICLKKEGKAEAIKEFLAFYKAEYILNDFSLKSLTDSSEAGKTESLTQLLKTVQESLTKK